MTEIEDHDDFGGLSRDLPHLIDRRLALRLIGGASLAGVVAACGTNSNPAVIPQTPTQASGQPTLSPTITATGQPTASPTITATGQPTASPTITATGQPTAEATSTPAVDLPGNIANPGAEIPSETAGPFPANGTNGPNVLAIDGIVRADLTSSVGEFSGTAQGIPTAIHLTVVDASTGSPLPGASIYLWHCTADGRYSIYEISDQNFLRGVQAADGAGKVVFNTVFPGCYRGRWPHCHFEVHDSLSNAVTSNSAIKTSQLAIPRADCENAYIDSRYGNSARDLARLTLASDSVFRDGWQDQLATVTGSNADGYSISLLVRV